MNPNRNPGKCQRKAPSRKQKVRPLSFETLELRALMAGAPYPLAPPTIAEMSRDRSSPGFNFVFRGEATPFLKVRVLQADGQVVGQTTVEASREWTLTYTGAQLAGGEFRFRAVASDDAGVDSVSSPGSTYRPNFVLVNTDDMAAHDLSYMPLVNQLLVNSGTKFTNSFVPTSLSGPSRASLLTGQYAHSNGGFENSAPWGGAVNYNAATALPNLLHEAGYRTAAFGKNETKPDVLESSHPGDPPTGWDEFSTGSRNPWDPAANGYYYYRDGIRTVVPDEPGGATHVWTKLAESFIQRNGANDSPFMLYVAPEITHRPYLPAPQHAGSLDGLPDWRPPSYNIVPSDIVNVFPKSDLARWDNARQRHLETLQSVDEAVGRLYNALSAAGELDNTIFVFTADNGLMWGEHAIFGIKNMFFDESLRVPLVIRDGRMPAARVTSQLALNVDIAPTFAHLAGVALPTPVDGRDLLPVVHGDQTSLRSAFIMEHQWTEGYEFLEQGFGTGGVGIRTNTWKYVEYESGKRDLFNLANDPFEMHNLGNDPDHANRRQSLATQMRNMLPSDTTGPVIASLTQYVEFDEKGLPYLRVVGTTTDADTGGSAVRTPEYFIDHVGRPGWGQPLDHADGGFDANTEAFQGRIPLSTLAQLAPGPHTLYVRGRDVAGNWGPLRSSTINLIGNLDLAATSDTGAFQADGVTVDQTPTIQGVAAPGARIRLYVVRPHGSIAAIGNVLADASGKWTKTLSLAAGLHRIIGVTTIPGDSTPRFTTPLYIHVAGAYEPGLGLRVVGTHWNDHILVQSVAATGKVHIVVNGVSAGAIVWSGKVQIDGLAGHDRLTMRGHLPATLSGGEGDDVLRGGENDDVLAGDAGNNQLQGGNGDDRFVFSQPAGQSNNVITEYVGGGFDTLDFSSRGDRFVLNFGAPLLAYNVWSRNNTTVRAAAGTPLSYEAVRSSSAGGVLAVPETVRVISGGGHDRISVRPRIEPGTAIPVRTLSVGNLADDAQLRCLLTLTQGSLHLSTLVPGGVPASEILDNGTNSIQLIGTRSQINATLRALTRLHVPRVVASSSLVIDLKLRSLSTGSVLEHITTTLDVNRARRAGRSQQNSVARPASDVLSPRT